VVSKPLKTDLNRENRLFLAEFVKDYDEADFLNFAFSDEFFYLRDQKAKSPERSSLGVGCWRNR